MEFNHLLLLKRGRASIAPYRSLLTYVRTFRKKTEVTFKVLLRGSKGIRTLSTLVSFPTIAPFSSMAVYASNSFYSLGSDRRNPTSDLSLQAEAG